MGLADLTRTGVLTAISEFDRRGRDAFLRSTGFSRANACFLGHGPRLYGSKAIAGYAHGVSTGTPLESGNFSGGDKTVARRLEALGFTVLNLDRPDWNRDELILACELVKINGWRQLDESCDGVKELSGGGEHATN